MHARAYAHTHILADIKFLPYSHPGIVINKELSHSLARGYPSSVTPSERQNGIKAVQFGKECIRSFDSKLL